MKMDPLFLAGLAILLLRGKGGSKPAPKKVATSSKPPQAGGPPPVSAQLRRELEQVGASPAIAAGLARWAALATLPGQESWLGIYMGHGPAAEQPKTVAGKILETFESLWDVAVSGSPKPLDTTDADRLWWTYADHYRPELRVASPGGSAVKAARMLATMSLPEADRTLLAKANWVAWGRKETP